MSNFFDPDSGKGGRPRLEAKEESAVQGTSELMRLAALLRLGADTSRRIGSLRPRDENSIERLACQADDMADELEAIASDRDYQTAGTKPRG